MSINSGGLPAMQPRDLPDAGREWGFSDGLIVPLSYQGRLHSSGNGRQKNLSGDDASHASSDWAARAQAWGAIAAAVIAVAALILSIIGLSLQGKANDLSQAASEEQYASRVAWWAVSEQPQNVLQLSIQNRSVVPISNVTLDGASGPYEFDTIPPCTIVTLHSYLVDLHQLLHDDLYFSDTNGNWKRGADNTLSRVGTDDQSHFPNRQIRTIQIPHSG